ncbi:MAG: hypothetical protein O6952_10155, partial [Planctomycetota bacterium]|nr:hypothetical protein [Planctomycetota bacterium]
MTLGRSLLMLSALALLAGDPSDPISVTFPFKLTDGHGYRWDIGPNGGIGDGSNDAYDGGVILRLNGVPF